MDAHLLNPFLGLSPEIWQQSKKEGMNMLQGQQMLMPSPPPSLDKDAPAWGDEIGASPLDIRQRIFCNRSLNMASIRVMPHPAGINSSPSLMMSDVSNLGAPQMALSGTEESSDHRVQNSCLDNDTHSIFLEQADLHGSHDA